jgi:ferredoxin
VGVVTRRVRVDWPACRARGLCHEVLPELVDLDEWGYPIVRGAVTEALLASAREAARVCPQLALRITTDG